MTLIVCSRCNASFTRFARSVPDIPSTRKHPTATFHEVFIVFGNRCRVVHLAIANVDVAVELSVDEFDMPAPCTLRMAISSSISEQTVCHPMTPISVSTHLHRYRIECALCETWLVVDQKGQIKCLDRSLMPQTSTNVASWQMAAVPCPRFSFTSVCAASARAAHR